MVESITHFRAKGLFDLLALAFRVSRAPCLHEVDGIKASEKTRQHERDKICHLRSALHECIT